MAFWKCFIVKIKSVEVYLENQPMLAQKPEIQHSLHALQEVVPTPIAFEQLDFN